MLQHELVLAQTWLTRWLLSVDLGHDVFESSSGVDFGGARQGNVEAYLGIGVAAVQLQQLLVIVTGGHVVGPASLIASCEVAWLVSSQIRFEL